MYITDEGAHSSPYPVPYGTFLAVKEGQIVEKGDLLFEWDPYAEPIITDVPGVITLSGFD